MTDCFCFWKVDTDIGPLHMLTSCTKSAKCKGSLLPLCLGIAWKGLLCFWSELGCSELFNICFLTLLLLSTYALAQDHKYRYRVKGHRHFLLLLCLFPRDFKYPFQTAPWQHCGEESFLFDGSWYVCLVS